MLLFLKEIEKNAHELIKDEEKTRNKDKAKAEKRRAKKKVTLAQKFHCISSICIKIISSPVLCLFHTLVSVVERAPCCRWCLCRP